MTPNVLATRYASDEIARIWSPEHKIVLERQLWIAVLKAQRDLGVETPDGVRLAQKPVRDLTENVEQLQVRQSLQVLRGRAVATLARLGRLASEHAELVMAGLRPGHPVFPLRSLRD